MSCMITHYVCRMTLSVLFIFTAYICISTLCYVMYGHAFMNKVSVYIVCSLYVVTYFDCHILFMHVVCIHILCLLTWCMYVVCNMMYAVSVHNYCLEYLISINCAAYINRLCMPYISQFMHVVCIQRLNDIYIHTLFMSCIFSVYLYFVIWYFNNNLMETLQVF